MVEKPDRQIPVRADTDVLACGEAWLPRGYLTSMDSARYARTLHRCGLVWTFPTSCSTHVGLGRDGGEPGGAENHPIAGLLIDPVREKLNTEGQ